MNINEYIASGVLEMYVMGVSSEEEAAEVERMAVIHPEIKKEIKKIEITLEKYALENKVNPPVVAKPFLMATIDYSERLRKGEAMTFPPILNENSKVEDYSDWLNREDMVLPADSEEIFAKIIGYTPEATTAIVWIKSMAPHEIHDDEYEKFLIVEGTCDITIGEKIHQLIPGDYLTIPLHLGHHVKITSSIPCKVILQRIAA
ncbi:MAG: cupin domain-containing protein [Bacteroidia bacterium]